MGSWPQIKTARTLVEEGIFPNSERTLLALAKRHQVGRIVGRTYVFTPADIELLLKRLPCPSNSSDEPARPTGTSGGQSAESAFSKALALATNGRPKTSSRSGTLRSSSGRSTVIPLQGLSLKRP